MSRAARSVFVFGCYLIGMSAILVVAPNLLLDLLQQPRTDEPWIRVLGVIVGVLGVYYARAGRADATWFFSTTVAIRLSIPLAFGLLVLLWDAPAVLMLFAVADVAGALWTWRALRAP